MNLYLENTGKGILITLYLTTVPNYLKQEYL